MKKSSLLILLLSLTVLVSAQQKIVPKPVVIKNIEKNADAPSGKFIGTLFSDFFYILQEPQSPNTTIGTIGRNAFVLRRASVGYEYSYSKHVAAKIEYDANANALLQGYVDVVNIVPFFDLRVGAMQTIVSETIEKVWEYRSLSANILDRKGYVHEFDRGVMITGKMNAHGTTYGRLAIYNGNGTAAENDKMKKLAVGFGNWFDKNSVIETYADYENLPGGKSTITGKVFYGMNSSTMGLGVEGFYRLERKMNPLNGSDMNPVGLSAYTWLELTKQLRGILRFDGVDNDLSESNLGYRELYVNSGLDYLPVPGVHLMPNLIYGKNLKKGNSPEIVDWLEVRLTTAVSFN